MIENLGGKGEKIMTILQEREQKGIQEGIELGMEQGELKKARESAITGLKKGYDMEIIMDLAGLTEKEINDIKKEVSN